LKSTVLLLRIARLQQRRQCAVGVEVEVEVVVAVVVAVVQGVVGESKGRITLRVTGRSTARSVELMMLRRHVLTPPTSLETPQPKDSTR
jgi:hypothetical protein